MKRKWIVILAAVVLLAGIGLKAYTDQYVWVAGVSVSREESAVDLRGKSLSVKRFQRLQEQLPDCEILWDVPLQEERYPSDTEHLTVSALTQEDAAALECFPALKILDASGCIDYDILLAFSKAHPACTVIYQVAIGAESYGQDTTRLVLEEDAGQELLEKLQYLPLVEEVEFSQVQPEKQMGEQLREAYPKVHFRCVRTYGERSFSSDDEMLDFSGMEITAQAVEELMAWFPEVGTVQLTDSSLTDREIMDLADAHGSRFFLWNMTIGEHSIPTDAVEVDISGHKVESTREIEDLLPYFPRVEKVIMSHCGLDDETMDALNKRYEDIRFVWSIKVQRYYVRTDADHFFPFKFSHTMEVTSEDMYPLRYCTDMVAIDVGHSKHLKDCEWAAFMPNLTYLVIADTSISDISPLGGLKNLVFLEMFGTKVTDFTPLVNCTSLVDLNICRLTGDWRPLTEMTWLEHLWWNGIRMHTDKPCVGAEEELPKYLPNTVMQFNRRTMVHDNGWRELTHYKDMRDAMDMFYLD